MEEEGKQEEEGHQVLLVKLIKHADYSTHTHKAIMNFYPKL